MSEDDVCRSPCPRHEGHSCQISGIGNPDALFGSGKGPLFYPAKTTCHRHSHTMPTGVKGTFLSHYWGGKAGHRLSLQGRAAGGSEITEAQFDAILRGEVDVIAYDRWLWYQHANKYRAERGLPPMALPEDLKGFIAPPEREP